VWLCFYFFITARCYAVVRCLSVRLSVCLSHADILSKRLNSQHINIIRLFTVHTTLVFAVSNVMAIFWWEPPNRGIECRGGMKKSWFSTNFSLYLNKKLSCRREAARCFVFVCSQLRHTYSAVFLLLVTAASDLLVHKILLNYVLLSPIVFGGIRPKLPGQTPLVHNPIVCCRLWVAEGRLGSGPRLVGRIGSGVRVSVSFQQNYPPGSVLRCPTAAECGVMTKRVVSGDGGGLSSVSGV